MTIAVLVYRRMAEATTALNSCVALIPDGSDRSKEGDKSKMELGEGRMDHWCTGGSGPPRRGSEATLTVAAGTGGTKDQAWAGSMYKSRRDEGGFMTFELQ
jgi:hypothetical protein